MRTGTRVAVLVAVAAAMAWPALRSSPTDDFPLSTYPMFASDRGDISVIATAVGVDADGDVVRLSPELLAATDEPMQAISTAAQAVRDGRAEAWCAEVAARLASAGGETSGTDVVAVEVRVETHDAVAHFTQDAPPVAVDVRASCPVAP